MLFTVCPFNLLFLQVDSRNNEQLMELTECAFGRNIYNENKVIFMLVPLNTLLFVREARGFRRKRRERKLLKSFNKEHNLKECNKQRTLLSEVVQTWSGAPSCN